jgi:hypothetical protein
LFVCIDVSRANSHGDEVRASWPLVFVAVGGVGLVVMFMAAGSSDWGPPGTEAYESYQMMNRLVTFPAALLVLGVFATGFQRRRSLGVLGWVSWLLGLTGSLLVLGGNVAEFWLFTSRSYGDAARNLAWSSFLLGVALLFIAGILGTARASRGKPAREFSRT